MLIIIIIIIVITIVLVLVQVLVLVLDTLAVCSRTSFMNPIRNETHNFLLDSFDPWNKTFHPCEHSRTVSAAKLS